MLRLFVACTLLLADSRNAREHCSVHSTVLAAAHSDPVSAVICATLRTIGHDKQGYLTKNGDVRYCVLSQGSLAWSSKPLAKVQNAIPLRHYSVTRVDELTIHLESAAIINVRIKPYTFVCASAADADDWLVALRSWTEPSSAVDFAAASDAPAAAPSPSMRGWLAKKGKSRYFVLEAGVLFWCTKETADYRKSAAGSLELRDCIVTALDDKTFELHSSQTGANYVLASATGAEAQRWVETLVAAICIFGATRETALGDARLEHRGTLVKKGQKRFLLLKRTTLSWYDSDAASTPNGSLPLARVTVSLDGACGFKVTSSDFDEWAWLAPSAEEADRWVEKIRAASQAAKRVDMEARNERLKVSGTVAADATEVFFKQAFVKKGGDSRVLQLRGNTLLWFEKLAGSDDPSNCKNSIDLAGATAVVSPEDANLLLVSRGVGDRAPRRFVFPDSASALEWTDVLERAAKRATLALAAASSSSAEAPLRRGFLLATRGLQLTGARRFHVLTRSALTWFASDEQAAGGAPLGCVPLASCSVAIDDGVDTRVILREATGTKLVLECGSTSEAIEWNRALTTAIGNANRVLQPDRVFAVPLADIEARLREKHGNGSKSEPPPLPPVLTQCLDWLTRYGLQTEGLLRISGDLQNVLTFKNMFDRGLQVALPSVAHDVAGILKLWLRELPEPLLTFALYSRFIELTDGDVDGLRALLDLVPAINMRVLRRLMQFLVLVLQNESVNKMGAKNVAIVVGPTLLRCPVADNSAMTELRDTPKVLALTQLLLCEHVALGFEAAAPAPTPTPTLVRAKSHAPRATPALPAKLESQKSVSSSSVGQQLRKQTSGELAGPVLSTSAHTILGDYD